MPNPFGESTYQASLVVISVPQFESAVAELLQHKNTTGMPAVAAYVPEIAAYFAGGVPGQFCPADDAEAVKLAIAYAFENLQTKYVLLLGAGSLVPVRYWFSLDGAGPPDLPGSGIEVPCTPNGAFVQSDLYFANLYQHTGSYPDLGRGPFSTWSESDNGLYNQSSIAGPPASLLNTDAVDGYPDLAVSRIPASTLAQAMAYVQKVISYETSQPEVLDPLLSLVHCEQYSELDLSTNFGAEIKGYEWPGSMAYLLFENYPCALSMVAKDGGLTIGYIESNGAGGLLLISAPNGTSWPAATTSLEHSSVTGPCLAPFAPAGAVPRLWMAFVGKDPSGQSQVYLASSADSWVAKTAVPGVTSKSTPSLAAFGGELYLAFVLDDDESDPIQICSSANGATGWSTPVGIGQESCGAPVLVTFTPPGQPETLFMAFVSDSSSNQICICSSTSGTQWSPAMVLETAPSSGTPPALAVFGGLLWLAFADFDSGQIWVYTSPDGVTWGQAGAQPPASTSAAPALAVADGALWLAATGLQPDLSLQILSLASAVAAEWQQYPALAHAAALAPAPFTEASPKAVGEAAQQSFWVSYIGHGGPDGWGHNEIFTAGDIPVSTTGPLPVVLAAGCQTTLFQPNLPWSAGFNDAHNQPRGMFSGSAAPATSLNRDELVAYEGSAPPGQSQSWTEGLNPPHQPQPSPYTVSGSWSPPVLLPPPGAYQPDFGCIGNSWVTGSATGGAIAYFGVHDVAPPGPDIEMDGYLLQGLIEHNQAAKQSGTRQVLGDLYLSAQRSYWQAHQGDAAVVGSGDYHSIPRLYLGWMLMFGDPSLRLPMLGAPILPPPPPGLGKQTPPGLTVLPPPHQGPPTDPGEIP